MDRLILLLREIDADETIPNDKNTILECSKEIQSLAMELFIDEQGNPIFDNMDVLQQISGFYIFPGERDRFGWLTACIQTKKGIIVFG